MKTFMRAVDSITEGIARTAHWLCVALVLVIVNEIVMRYVFDHPTVWAYETSTMLGATVYVFGFSYALRCGTHIRVDIIYRLLSERNRALVDVIGGVVFFFPLAIGYALTSAAWMIRAWRLGETMIETPWYPPMGPIRTVVAMGFALLLVQGVTQFMRDSRRLARKEEDV